MRLKPNLLLEVSLPASSRANVNAILKRRRAGLKGNLTRISKSMKIFDGRKVLYKGDYYRLAFVPSQSRRISLRDGIIVLPNYTKINLRQVLKDWMSKETEKLVEKRLKHLGRRLKLTANGFSIRDTQKWAYCTRDQRIVFNPQLVALPSELADYVMVRELARLREFGHSKTFKHALASFVHDFNDKELLLKRFITE